MFIQVPFPIVGFNKTSIADFYDKLEKDENGLQSGRGFGIPDDANHSALARAENGLSGKTGSWSNHAGKLLRIILIFLHF